MFERYTELARRAVFFARFEASELGCNYIESEHILLGILREDPSIRQRLGADSADSIRTELGPPPLPEKKIPVSVDLPLSRESKQALAYAAEESERLGHKWIGCSHLLIGLLRVKECKAASLLSERGVDLASFRKLLANYPPVGAAERPSPWEESAAISCAAESLQAATKRLAELVDQVLKHADRHSEVYGSQLLKRKNWMRKEALGHLVDWAACHQQWFARAVTEPKLEADGYPSDEWVTAQDYRSAFWPVLLDAWIGLNRLLVHLLANVPEEKTKLSCKIGIANPVTLEELVKAYVDHCEDVLGQILALHR